MADEEPRRYQTRARSKIAEDHISTKSIPTKPPAPSSKPLRNTTVAAKSVEVTLKAKNGSSAATTTTAVRPTRKAASATTGAIVMRETVPKATSIPIPTRTTRSGKAAAAISLSKTTGDDKEQKLPNRKGAAITRGKKKTFSEDKENQGPASEIEAELKQQEMAAADSQPSNPLSLQPVRKLASGGASLGTPIKNAIRPIGSLKPKEPEPTLISLPKRTHQSTSIESISPDSVDELEGPISVGLQSQARRPNNPVRLQPPEQVNLLASPPRRNASQHARPDRPLPAMVLTFDQPALLMQSPAKRGSGVGQSPMRGSPGKLAMPPKMDLLSSPPKRPVKKPVNEAEVEKEVDELSLDTYSIENSPKRPVLKKGQSFVPLRKEPKDLFTSKKKHAPGPAPASAKTDAEGDVEMTDVDTDVEDVLASPCPAHHSQSQSFGLFGENEGWDLSPTSERGVTPLVTGLEDLNMGLEGSRRSLFPKHKGQEKSIALENSAQLEIRHGNEENTTLETIPIDPMLLEEDFTEGRGPRKISTQTGNDSSRNKERRQSNVLAGAVVYIDVYIPENPTAPDTLVEMLHGMGAKTVQQWAWNPTAGNGGAGKIGITHVVFKDGSSTTLQKVTESKGVVTCVDLGWVIECDKEQKWIDEGLFLIDSDDALMSAHRRRSIDTKGPVVVSHHSSRGSPSGHSNTTRQFHVAVDGAPAPVIKTTGEGSPFGISNTQPSSFAAPQVDRLGFYIGGDANQPASLMEKLILVRRKSLKHAPKIGSPLGKNCQWADY